MCNNTKIRGHEFEKNRGRIYGKVGREEREEKSGMIVPNFKKSSLK